MSVLQNQYVSGPHEEQQQQLPDRCQPEEHSGDQETENPAQVHVLWHVTAEVMWGVERYDGTVRGVVQVTEEYAAFTTELAAKGTDTCNR